MIYDVIIVGAGPAGSSTAYGCAQRDLKTVLIDRRVKPGTPKQCAEGINQEILKELGIEMQPEWSSHQIDSIMFSNYKNHLILKGERTKGYVLDRKKFDFALVERAEKAGAQLMLGMSVVDLKGKTVVLDNGTKLKGKVIVGADGPMSIIGKKSGLGNPDCGCGYQYEIKTRKNKFLKTLQLYLDADLEPEGYLWVFPKNETLNVGMGASHSKNLKKPLDKFVKKLGLEGEPIKEVNAGCIPLHGPIKKFQTENVLLVGDAAGHTNPLSGGGIPVAIFDGILAAEVIYENIKKGSSLEKYQKKWEKSPFGKATKVSLKVQKTFFRLLKEKRFTVFLNAVGKKEITSVMQVAREGLKIPGLVNKSLVYSMFKRFMKYYKYSW